MVGAVAWSTYRTLHRRHQRLQPHHAVNRLVLGQGVRAGRVVLVAGGYLGYALSWLGSHRRRAGPGTGAALAVGAAAAVLLVVGSLLLERACRVGKDEG